jgi:hypothetical protein
VFAQKIVAWHCATAKDVELVMTPLRMAAWHQARLRTLSMTCASVMVRAATCS